jgi:phosphoribosyl 1,2-cyclic phosphate phosphodiesterase
VYGYRIGPIAYATDVKSVPAEAIKELRGVRILVLSALWWRPHPPIRASRKRSRLRKTSEPSRTYLTHLSHETAHQALLDRLPAGVEPGYDGLSVEVEA